MAVKDDKATADLAASYRRSAQMGREAVAFAAKSGIDLPAIRDGAVHFDKWAEDLENGTTYVTTEHGS